jgi:hypothetical protein
MTPFVKPVDPGMTCQPGLDPGQVRLPAGQAGFTVKEKVDQAPAPKRSGDGAEKRTPEDPAKAGQVVA